MKQYMYLTILVLVGIVTGGWKKEEESKDVLEAFNPSSFNIQENWAICKRAIIRIPLINTTQDYVPQFKEAFEKLNAENGGSILLEKGTYRVSGPVLIPENCCILGAGMDVTTIILNPNALPLYNGHAMRHVSKGILSCSRNARITVIGITVDGNIEKQYSGHKFFDFGRYGVSFERCNYVWFRNVRSKNNQLYGFFIRGVGKHAGYGSYIEACVADGNGLDGIEFRSMHYASVFNSILLNNARHGISINGRSRNNLIKSTRVLGSRNTGLKLWSHGEYAPYATLVTDSYFIDSKNSGISVEGEKVNNTMLRKVTVANTVDQNAVCYRMNSKLSNFILQDNSCHVLSGIRFSGLRNTQKCTAGVLSMNVCCKLSCGRCGGSGCSKLGSSKSCCISAVRNTKRSCERNGPPCILS